MQKLLPPYSTQQMMLRRAFFSGLAMTGSELALAGISFSLRVARRRALSDFSSGDSRTRSDRGRARLQWQQLKQAFEKTEGSLRDCSRTGMTGVATKT